MPAWLTSPMFGAGLVQAAPISVQKYNAVNISTNYRDCKETNPCTVICLWIKQREMLSFYSSVTPKSVELVTCSTVSMVK